MAAPAAYSDPMKNSSSLHLHEGFMAVVVYSKPRQSQARGVKEIGLRNEGGRKNLSPRVRLRTGISWTESKGGRAESSADTLRDAFPPPLPRAHVLP